MNPVIQFERTVPPRLIALVLALMCLALLPQARAVCQDACLANHNTVQGDDALFSLTAGADNTAIGFNALFFTTNGSNNTAIGSAALLGNTTGSFNTAIGSAALNANTSGTGNTATGRAALQSNTTGNFNTANGFGALIFTTGNSNTATGFEALQSNTTGSANTAIGNTALFNNTGSSNIALGAGAGYNLTNGNNNIDIGNDGVANDNGTIRIGTGGTQTAIYVAGVSGVTVAKGVGVVIDSNGQLGTKGSSERFKDAIKPMDKASEAILVLKPVTFRYKKEFDPDNTPQFGLVAEDVEKVNPDLVARDAEGKPYTVRYEAVNAMLLNEFLKEHQKVQRLEAALAAVNERLKAQDAKIDKVNAKVELTKPAPQMIASDQ